jgi:hypothetical protein
VNVKIFKVIGDARTTSFASALNHIHSISLGEREQEVDTEVIIRLERHQAAQGLVAGEFIRLQSANLPPRAEPGQPTQPLGVASIGHSTVFVYHPGLSVIALQLARNGISSTRVGLYVRGLVSTAPDTLLPVPTSDVWQKLRTGRIRGVQFRMQSPDSLESADANARSVASGVRQLKATLGITNVDVTLSVGRGDQDIDHRQGLALVRWLQRERAGNRGGISALHASVIAEDSDGVEWLNLFEAQMGAKTRLELPDDDPQRSYTARLAFVRRVLRQHEAAIAEQED